MHSPSSDKQAYAQKGITTPSHLIYKNQQDVYVGIMPEAVMCFA